MLFEKQRTTCFGNTLAILTRSRASFSPLVDFGVCSCHSAKHQGIDLVLVLLQETSHCSDCDMSAGLARIVGVVVDGSHSNAAGGKSLCIEFQNLNVCMFSIIEATDASKSHIVCQAYLFSCPLSFYGDETGKRLPNKLTQHRLNPLQNVGHKPLSDSRKR